MEKPFNGKCELCGVTMGRTGMSRHLAKCGVVAGAKHADRFHLGVEGRGSKFYWLHLSAPQSAPLSQVDSYLRRIWLECCGHLSAFTIDGVRYSSQPMNDFAFFRRPEEKGMHTPLHRVLGAGSKFSYEYDFGSTTELVLRVVGERAEAKPAKGILLLARNDDPEFPCDVCGAKAATTICTECQWEGTGWLCDGCAKKHKCDEEMFLPVVNSPRVGVCGYTG